MAERLRIICAAKVNLFLHILGKRADGYHILESLVTFANVGDELMFEPAANGLDIEILGPYADALEDVKAADNLVIKAALKLEQHFDIKLNGKFILVKNLPVASGIGGGSSNAAAAIKLLLEYYKLDATNNGFDAMLLALGADVPVCFKDTNVIMSGIGEKLEVWRGLPPINAVLVNPNLAVSTAKIFKNLNANSKISDYEFANMQPANLDDYATLIEFLKSQRNDMQQSAIDICPQIGKVLSALSRHEGMLLNRMSGSGATCFGLFDSAKNAEMAARTLRAEQPNWWVKPCILG